MVRKKQKVKNEFRFNYSTKHPNYIFEESNGRYRGFGITHEKETFGRKNMPLKKNPQKGRNDPAYLRNGIVSDKMKSYSRKPLKNYSFDKDDFANVKAKRRHYKRKR